MPNITAAKVGMAVLLLPAVVLAACSSSGSGSAGSKNTITLYNGQHAQTTAMLVQAFEAQTGFKVKVRTDDENVLTQQIEAEGGSSPADVIYAENTPALEALREKHLLAPVDTATLAAVPSHYSSPENDWVGVSARVNELVYNTNALRPDQVPTSILGLADPKWRGKLAISPGEADFSPIVTAIAHLDGNAAALNWLKGVKANGAAHTYPDNETLTSEVNSGQVQLGVINHYYWWRLRDEIGPAKMHSALATFAPHDAGYVIDVSGAAVLASSKHMAAAQQLLAYLVSAKGEHIIATSNSWEYPLGSGTGADANLTPLSSLQPNSLTVADLGDGSTALKLLQQAQLL